MGREAGPQAVTPRTIIGVDPGDTTGVCVWQDMQSPVFGQLLPFQVVPFIRGYADGDMLVVCETFVIGRNTGKKKISPHVTDVIGRVVGLCEDLDVRFRRQTASEAKTFATNDLLKKVGWFNTGMGHAMDAARHVLLALAREHPHVFDEMTKPRA